MTIKSKQVLDKLSKLASVGVVHLYSISGIQFHCRLIRPIDIEYHGEGSSIEDAIYNCFNLAKQYWSFSEDL